jgi:hypothetical protein
LVEQLPLVVVVVLLLLPWWRVAVWVVPQPLSPLQQPAAA